MSIVDYILPRWKSSDPEIRLRAVRDMDASDIETLRQIAETDMDSNIRIEALQKISDTQTLHDIISKSSDLSVIQAAWNKLNAAYRDIVINPENDNETRKSILNRINGDEVIASLVTEIDDHEIRMAAIDRIFNPSFLCRITESNCGFKTGAAIVEKLSVQPLLERIAKNATNKKIRKMAQDKIDAMIEMMNKPSIEVQKQTELEKICKSVEEILESGDLRNGRTVISLSDSSWKQWDPYENHALRARYQGVRDALEAQLSAIYEKERAKAMALQEMDKLCVRIEALSEQAALTADTMNIISSAKERWNSIISDFGNGHPLSETEELEKRFKKACHNIETQWEIQLRKTKETEEQVQQLETCCRQFEEISEIENLEEAENKWKTLIPEWESRLESCPDIPLLKQRVEKAYEKLKQRRVELQNAEKQLLCSLCEEVEQLIYAENRSGLGQRVRDIQEKWKDNGKNISQIKAELLPRFENACRMFFEKQNEFREHLEWERWANLSLKEELCAVMEALENEQNLGNVAKVVREAHEKWKEIGPVSKEKAEIIWKRFKTASDRAYDRCLSRKNALYEQMETLLAPWSKDEADVFNWKETAEKIKEIQTEWNQIGFLPQTMEKDIRDAFQTACNNFFENRREHYQKLAEERNKNLEMKVELCEQAEALSLSEDWNATANRLKELQQNWKKIGAVPRKDADALWQRFRGACDIFFDRMEKSKPENLKKKQSLCEQAENLFVSITEDTNLEKLSRDFIDLQRQWRQTGPVPAENAQELWEKFHIICDEFFSLRKRSSQHLSDEQAENEKIKEELTIRAEALSDSTEWKTAAAELKALQKKWKEVGTAPRKKERELWIRFRSACDAFFSRRKAFFDKMDINRSENLKAKEALCLSIEMINRLIMPEESLTDRENAPMAEQLSMALEYKDVIVVPGDRKTTWENALRKVKQIQRKWQEIGPVPNKEDETIWNRYRKSLDQFFSARPTPVRAISAG